jgi:hypothetical protein
VNNTTDLERMRRFGAFEEQDRIIKLLDEVAVQQRKVLDFNANRKDGHDRELVIATIYQLTALIRKEQK